MASRGPNFTITHHLGPLPSPTRPQFPPPQHISTSLLALSTSGSNTRYASPARDAEMTGGGRVAGSHHVVEGGGVEAGWVCSTSGRKGRL
ncbi:hypothetical protein E2C01_086170 [Portunus trituberculatus]|uniref:Uncharacterized protein n=1 Tax=Portunus trituberculatus TaxID=210409 RepID=A0A5B7J024_PORTR|nr:hypothetical protein [Portunus trituberculatus]